MELQIGLSDLSRAGKYTHSPLSTDPHRCPRERPGGGNLGGEATQGYAAHPCTPSAGDHCRDVLDGVRLESSHAREARSPSEIRHAVQRVEQQGEIATTPQRVFSFRAANGT
jgi:hypothetical protein